MKLATGEKAPDFTGVDQEGNSISSDDFLGKYWLLYFYPKDNTPGCTKEACGFRDLYADLTRHLRVVGISADKPDSHKKFITKYNLPFPLVSDSSKKIIRAYGADGLIFPKRTSFLINPEGVIVRIYEKVNAEKHPQEVLDDIKNIEVVQR